MSKATQDEIKLVDELSPREIDIAILLHQGKSRTVIGSELGITVRTVDCYREKIRMKTRVKSPAGLILMIDRQLVELQESQSARRA